MDMDVALDQWLKQVTKIAQLPISEQEEVTKAGADVFAKKLVEITDKKHPSTKGNGGKYGHLADNIASQKGDVDGQHNGQSSVGFHNKAYIARFLNDGTKSIRGDHFVDNARDDVKDDVFAAESVAYKKILDKIQGGDGH